MAKNLSILGSTGSIGTQALDIVRQNPSDFKVVALSANQNIDLLAAQIKEFQPEIVAVMNPEKAAELQLHQPLCTVLTGLEGLIAIATHKSANLVLTAVVGAIGLEPTYEAIKAGKDIALANKETLVAAGEIMIQATKDHNVRIIPVDSEHSAIFQCLEGRDISAVEKIILTCSGGPFRGKTRAELKEITPDQALKHPTWDMGAKISIDSATLINKGLEVIEAHHLFSLPYDQIEVVVHPQSIIHSMVQFKDGNILAQMGVNDMRIAISYALYYPDKAINGLPRLPLPTQTFNSSTPLTSLTFERPDPKTFPGLNLAYEAGQKGGLAPAIFNAANEIAVQKFLTGEIKFLEIPEFIKSKLQNHQQVKNPDIEAICAISRSAKH